MATTNGTAQRSPLHWSVWPFVCVAGGVAFAIVALSHAWVTVVPTVWLVVCTLTAGWQKVFHEAPAIGFIAQASRFSEALAQGKVLAPAKSVADMHRVIFANYLDAALCTVFMAIVVAMIVSGVISIRRALATPTVSTNEVGYDTKDLGTARA
jgi:carbon starvation protein CstA